MSREKEFKVTIKSNGYIIHNGDLIAILGQWNRYDDLDPDHNIEPKKGRKK